MIFLSRYIDARPTASQVSTLMPMMTRTIAATIPMIAPMSMYFTDSRISASPDWEFLDLRNATRRAITGAKTPRIAYRTFHPPDRRDCGFCGC